MINLKGILVCKNSVETYEPYQFFSLCSLFNWSIMQSHFHLSHDLVLLFDKWRGKTLAGQSIPSTNSTDIRYTRKNAQVVTNLQQTCSNAVPTTCQQVVFSLLVPSLLASCQRLVDNLLQACCRAQQTCHKLFQQLVFVLQFNNLSTSCPSYTIPDSYRSDINLRCFPVLSALTTFHIWSFCLIMLYYHNFKCHKFTSKQENLMSLRCESGIV
jgi:hypothetical protein